MLSRCVQGLRVQEMTNGFIEPFEGRQAPADCCSTLRSTPEKLARRTSCVRLPRRGALGLSFTHGRAARVEFADRKEPMRIVHLTSDSALKSM